jgi:hypothetical protein
VGIEHLEPGTHQQIAWPHLIAEEHKRTRGLRLNGGLSQQAIADILPGPGTGMSSGTDALSAHCSQSVEENHMRNIGAFALVLFAGPLSCQPTGR